MATVENTRQLIDRVEAWILANDVEALADCFRNLPVDETILVASRLETEHQIQLLEMLPPDVSVDVLRALPFASASDLVDEISAASAAEILGELPPSEQADLVGEMEPDQAEAVLALLDAPDAARVKSLVSYPDDVAGGLMDNHFLALSETMSVATAIDGIRTRAGELSDYDVQYVYVLDRANRLVGVLRLRDLLLASDATRLDKIMIPNPRSVTDYLPLDDLREFFTEHQYLGVPVVNKTGQMQGVVNRTAVEHALGDRNADDFLKARGIIQEELRTMPLLTTRSRRRLMWLSANIVLNLIAASVIAAYEETLKRVIALAVFLPIISDMSGCSGNQAVAVSKRELSLGVVEPREVVWVWMKEISVGLINGLALGILLAGLAWMWQGNVWLGGVVGFALMVNTTIAVSIGGTLPLIMKLLRLEPALASGPILTTVTDLFGFFLVLGMATQILHLLK